MIISINDHPDIRALFKGFDIQRVDYHYTVGGGGAGKKVGELIIKSW